MIQFESSVKYVPYSQGRVYDKLSDLRNLEAVREQLADKVEGLTFDSDSLSFKAKGMDLALRIVDREPVKCVKFESEKSPVSMNLWIQMLSVGEDQAKLKVTLRAEVSMLMKSLISKSLQDGVEKLADMLSRIPY